MKKESKEAILFEIGKFLIDIAKLVFGGVILAGIMKYENINQWLLFGLGGSVVLACFSAGAILTALFKLIVFLCVVGLLAAGIGIWGAIQLHNEGSRG